MKPLYISYDTAKYDFVAHIAGLFGTTNLEDLHEQHNALFQVGADSCTSFHKIFYDKYRAGWPEMVDLYERFIKEVVSFMYRDSFLYQKFPTFRVHLRDNLAVGAFHNDAQFGHPAGEINYIIPLTDSDGTASVWVESDPGKEDFAPMVLRAGQLIKFNGNQLTHGNKVNTTGKARVSMDFRVLPADCYSESSTSESVTLKTKLKEGEYYKRFMK
jgi:hypothetical protein